MKQIESADPNVREAAFESIATLLKVVGERPMNLYIEAIDKTKMAKVNVSVKITLKMVNFSEQVRQFSRSFTFLNIQILKHPTGVCCYSMIV